MTLNGVPVGRSVAASNGTAISAPRRTYTIEAGDTLDQVALEHDTTVERLLELNPRIDPTSLQVGQTLVVPG